MHARAYTHARINPRTHARNLSESLPADDAAVFRFDDAISLRDVGRMHTARVRRGMRRGA